MTGLPAMWPISVTFPILDFRFGIVRMVDTGGKSATIWEQKTLDFVLSRSLTKPNATPSSSRLSLSPYMISVADH